MTDRLARAAGPTRAGRTRANEPITALEPAAIEGGRLTVELRSGDRLERFEVRQFTPDWVVVEVRGDQPPAPERTAAKLEISGPGGFVEQFRCELEFSGWMAVSGNLDGDDGDKLGVARLLLDCEKNERSELIRAYRRLCFPALFDRGEVDVDKVLALFEQTGYCGRSGGLPRPSASWCAAEFPAELSTDVLYCADDGALLGHVSVTRAYSQTWIVHQLTTVDEHPQSAACRAALYNHFATLPILIDGHQQQYLFGYYDRSKPWHQLFFDSFVDWYDERDKVASVPFDRYEFVGVQTPPTDGRRLELDQARPAELEQAVALIREQLSPLACAAFDIDAALLDRAYLHPDYAAHGIARGRRVFVVRDAGELVGLALCEAGSEDFNLGNLFTVAQLYFRAKASSVAQQALVTFVRNHYRAIGQLQPLLLAPAGSLAEPEHAGLTLVETLGCVIWSGQSLRAYRTFLRNAFARLQTDARTRTRKRASEGPRAKLDSVYLPRVAEARARLQTDARLAPLLSGVRGPVELLGFLLHASALAVRMAESADWVRRAGFASAAAGRVPLAAALVGAADRETDRAQRLIEDLFELGQRWADELGVRINVELLLHQPPPRSLLRWAELRETIATGPCPVALLAVELELGAMFAQLGPALLDTCARMFDGDLRPSLAFARGADESAEHRALLERAVADDPSIVEALAEAGSVGLSTYLDVLGDCVELGRELAERVRDPVSTRSREPARALRLAFA